MSHRVWSLAALVITAPVHTACIVSTPPAVGARSPGPVAECPPLAPSSYRVTGAELRATHVPNLLEAVTRVRPRFLRSHAPRRDQSPVVYLDGTRMGPVRLLRDVPVMDVVDVVFVGAADATTRFGTDHAGGALLVRTHSGAGKGPCA